MKFSIRDLLLVTVIVALALGWWVDRRRLEKEIEQLRKPAVAFGLTTDGTPTPTLDLEFRTDDRRYDSWRNEFHPTFDTPPWMLPNSSAPAPNPPKD